MNAKEELNHLVDMLCSSGSTILDEEKLKKFKSVCK